MYGPAFFRFSQCYVLQKAQLLLYFRCSTTKDTTTATKDTYTKDTTTTTTTNGDVDINASSIHSQLHFIQSIAVSTIVTQFSGMNAPLVYPLIRQTWDWQRMEEGAGISNSNGDHEGDNHDGGDKKQSRRLSVELDGTIGSSILNDQLQDDQWSTNADGHTDVELDCQSKCQVKSDELFISMLPWMK